MKALIFDLDGTLVDSVYAHVLAWQVAFAEAGMPIDGWRLHRRMGMSGGLFKRAVMRELGRTISLPKLQALDKRHGELFHKFLPHPRPLPGAVQLLRFLRKNRVIHGVATSNQRPHINSSLKALGIPWATTPSPRKPSRSSSAPAKACCDAPAISAWVRSSKPSAIRPAWWTSNKSTASSSNPIGGKTVTNPSPKSTRWTREQIRAARLAPLVPLLQKRGLQFIAQDADNFILPAYPGLILKDSYWRWPERNLAGNAIDFCVQVLGLSFHDAMRLITGA